MNDGKFGINGDQETKEKTDKKEPIFYYEDNIKEPPVPLPSYIPFTLICPRCGSLKFKRKRYISYKDIVPHRRTRYTCRKCGYEFIDNELLSSKI